MGEKLRAALSEMERAHAAIAAMKAAESIDAFDDAWKDCIGRLARMWFKTEASLKGDPRFFNSARVKEVKAARAKDPLIQYLFQARHADEHGTEEVTERVKGNIRIYSPTPGHPLYLRSLSMDGNELRIDAPFGYKATFQPSGVYPRPVKNHGRVYEVPTEHLGKPLPQPATLLDFASLGVAFYDRIITGLASDGWDS